MNERAVFLHDRLCDDLDRPKCRIRRTFLTARRNARGARCRSLPEAASTVNCTAQSCAAIGRARARNRAPRNVGVPGRGGNPQWLIIAMLSVASPMGRFAAARVKSLHVTASSKIRLNVFRVLASAHRAAMIASIPRLRP